MSTSPPRVRIASCSCRSISPSVHRMPPASLGCSVASLVSGRILHTLDSGSQSPKSSERCLLQRSVICDALPLPLPTAQRAGRGSSQTL
eukprot:765667-Hanusia_phi.AAC.1